jgi:VanZ family protein
MAFAIYVSLIPFELRPIPLESAWTHFQYLMLSSRRDSVVRSNFIANILLFVPIGFGLAGALLWDRARRLAVIPAAVIILPVSIAVSLTAEFLQLFAPGRVTNRADVVAQTIGCVIGIAAWAMAGPDLTNWIRVTMGRSRDDRVARALVAYASVWIVVNLAPFDITVDLGELARRVRTGHITLAPFGGDVREPARLAWDAFTTTLSAIPLGMLGLVGWTGRAARRPATAAFAFGAALVASMEIAHLFIRSHAADTADVLFGCLGVALGVWAGVRVLGRDLTATSVDRVPRTWAVWAFVGWCLVLGAYHWMPYNFAVDPALIRRKVEMMSLIPFVNYRFGSDLNALSDVLVKISLAAPLGVIAAFVVPRGANPTTVLAGWVIVSALVFGGIEAGQLFLPSRIPDPTDVMVGVAASSAGVAIGLWLQAAVGASGRPSPSQVLTPPSRRALDR